MTIKVQVLNIDRNLAKDIHYGLVVEPINKLTFNMGRAVPLFDTEVLSEFIIPLKTTIKYQDNAIRGIETIAGLTNEDGSPNEVTFHYILPGEFILEIDTIEDKDGDA